MTVREAVVNDDEEARNKFLDLSDKADLNRETDFPKAIIFLTRDMLKPYLLFSSSTSLFISSGNML